jgi:hypothetical protein
MRERPGFIIGFFLVSFSLLFLEILITRIFSYVLAANIAYLVISIALLGLGAGGVFDALRPVAEPGIPRRLALLCLFGSFSLVLVFIMISWIGFPTLIWTGISVLLYYPLVFIPFFFLGLVLASVFRVRIQRVGFIYGINMAASGLGCLAAIALLRPMGAESELLAGAGLIALAGAFFATGRARLIRASCLVMSLLFLLLSLQPDLVLSFKAAGMKPVEIYRHKWPDFKIDYSKWDPLGKVDVFSSEQNLLVFGDSSYKTKGMTIDGLANTPVIPWGQNLYTTPFFKGSFYGQGYIAGHHPEKVLIIGLGGGVDVQAALHFGAKEIIGVEVNRSVIDAIKGPLRDYLGDLYQQPQVTIVHADGRHFIARSSEKYDLIQFTGVDTSSELQWGLNLHAESYLYTHEAFVDYFRHLEPGGILAMTWFDFYPPRVMLRAAAIAATALADMGAEHPERHFIICQQSCFVCMLVRPLPFTDEEIKDYAAKLKATEFKDDIFYDFGHIKFKQDFSLYIRYAPGIEPPNAFTDLMQSFREGREDEFIRNYIYDISVTYDDQPFFWKYYSFQAKTKGVGLGLLLMILQLLQAAGFSLLFILYPLKILRSRDKINIPRSGMVAAYFVLLGLGYMFIEVCLMQRFAFYLGNPAYSIATILGGLLVSSGAGAAIFQKMTWSAKNMVVLAVVFIVLILTGCYLFIVPRFVYETMDLSLVARTLSTLVWVMPLGLLMGIPFPAGLRMVGASQEQAVPWGFGINAAASVVGTILCVFIAMEFNFTTVLATAAGLYLFAGLIIRVFPR